MVISLGLCKSSACDYLTLHSSIGTSVELFGGKELNYFMNGLGSESDTLGHSAISTTWFGV